MITSGQVLAFLGLLNGMIGGTVLVLPLLGEGTGYLFIPVISILYALISYYTCYLIITHLGQSRDINQAILEHFDNRQWVLTIYKIIIALSLVGIIINYFSLIIRQLEGFIPPSKWIAVGVFVFLIMFTVIMKYIHFGEKLLAIGIVSIVCYIIFLTWAQVTTPHSPKRLPRTGSKFVDLAASLTMGYSIQNFFVEVLLRTTTNNNFKKIIFWVFVVGAIVYTYISFGAYAIINRKPRVQDPQSISQYFLIDGWEVRLIQGTYLYHLISATPQFAIIMQGKFLQICKVSQSTTLTLRQFFIYVCLYLLCYLLYTLKIKIAMIIQINGSVNGFFIVFLVPIVLHIKCVFFHKEHQRGETVLQQLQNGELKIIQNRKKCCVQYNYKYIKYVQLVFQLGMLFLGGYTIYYTFKLMFWGTENETVSDQL